ncbi:hypothetical protein [Actinoplanes auranticolor]|uniref:Uncharacterized protein n=1 Tax=Actinoplanes auranticolor TaxID=47988 RepID=A0A919S6C4_9ACTN|nr:hypothetical protein [Actinoplanes auranticolor]GIM66370.1 hypothetical protein Aau02nite_22810 [Actinoplanes auranticolor]
MSKTVPVSFGDQFLWAYDVSFGILLLEAIDGAAGMSQPEGAGDVLEGLRAHAQVGASAAFALDDQRWSPSQRTFVHRIIAEAGRRMRERGIMTRLEAEARYVTGNEPFALRFEEYVDGAVVAELAEAMNHLIHDDLPPVPDAGRHWFYGVEDGPRTT